MAMIRPFTPFSLPFAATASFSFGQTGINSALFAARFQNAHQSSAYVNSDQSFRHLHDAFRSGTLFLRVNTLFMQREQALETMAGNLLANNQKDTVQNSQTIELTLDLAGVLSRHGEA